MKAFISRRDFLKAAGITAAAAGVRTRAERGDLLFRKRLFCRRQDH